MKHLCRQIITGGCLLILGACAALPDLSGYAQQTRDLTTAINKAYTQTETDVTRRYIKTNRKFIIDTLRNAWEPTRQALTALAAYADALAKCTAAQNDPRALHQLGAQLNRLAATARNFAPIQGRAASEIANAAIFLIKQAQLAATRRKLGLLLTDADVVIQRISVLLQENLTDLHRIHRIVLEDDLDDLSVKYAKIALQYEERLKINESLMPEMLAIAEYKQAKLQARKASLLQQISIDRNPMQAASEEELVKRREADILQVYNANQEFLKNNESVYKEYVQSLTAMNEKMVQASILHRNTIAALQAWASVHASLKQIDTVGKAFSFAEFVTAVQNMQQVYTAYDKPFNPPRR
ncbi:MAG: hypothetical protein RMJ87_00405 [Cytophagales bacterium]|nr:hypothetical protein [Bernardetiaceae bacterium]MDW8203461.1 hypothetical protein [Cytophagales bacterium]